MAEADPVHVGSAGRRLPEGSFPVSARLAWISPRRTATAIEGLAAQVTSVYLLHRMLMDAKLPLEERSSTHLVAVEVPRATLAKFEHDLLRLVAKIRKLGPHVAVVVQPSLRKKRQRSLWAQHWNRLDSVPFKFFQHCSCKMGDVVPTCHLVYYVGCSFAVASGHCSAVPTLGASYDAAKRSLGGVIATLFASLLSAENQSDALLPPFAGSRPMACGRRGAPANTKLSFPSGADPQWRSIGRSWGQT